MIGGIALLGVVTAAIASWLVEQVGTRVDDATEAEIATTAEFQRLSAQLDQLTELVQKQHALLFPQAEADT
jgi:voltage-gated potassium channel